MRNKKNIWQENVFLNIPLFLLGLNYVLYNALAMDSMKLILRVIAISLLLVGWVLNGRLIVNRKSFLAIVLAILSLMLNGSLAFNFAVIVLFSICSTYSLDTIIRSAFRINVVLVLLMILLMSLHIVNNTSYISTMGRLRYTMGFENPNVAALFYSSAIYLLIISRKKIKGLVVFGAFLMSIIVFFYTNSRTSLLALLSFVLLESMFLFFEKRNRQNAQRILEKCSILIIDILFALNLVSVFVINRFMVFDELLSFRISTFSKMINSSGLKCFLLGGTLETVDNFYYMLLFQYGVFIYVFVAISTHFAMKSMVANKNIKYISLLVGLFLVAMMESSLIRPEILVGLIIWKIVLSGSNDYLADDMQISEETG